LKRAGERAWIRPERYRLAQWQLHWPKPVKFIWFDQGSLFSSCFCGTGWASRIHIQRPTEWWVKRQCDFAFYFLGWWKVEDVLKL
jgi:hypothetical protein